MQDISNDKTGDSNTRLDSQKGFTTCVDTLSFYCRKVESGRDLRRILKAMEGLIDEPIEFSESRLSSDGQKQYPGSGTAPCGLKLYYTPPVSSDHASVLGHDGNLITHPGLIPPQHCPVDAQALAHIRERLPEGAKLAQRERPGYTTDQSTGFEYPNHGWYVDTDDMSFLESAGELKVHMSGQVLARVDEFALAVWCFGYSAKYGIEASRVDFALDDHEKTVSIAEVLAARDAENYRGAKGWRTIESGGRKRERGIGHYFGSNKSVKQLRIYDKTVESGGKILGNRWEVQFRRKAAATAFDEWVIMKHSSNEQGALYIANVVTGAIKFCDTSSGDKNVSRLPLLDWFESFVERLKATPLKIRVAVVKQSIQRAIDWHKRQVKGSMAMMSKVLGDDFMPYVATLVIDGEEKLNNHQRRLIAKADKAQLIW